MLIFQEGFFWMRLCYGTNGALFCYYVKMVFIRLMGFGLTMQLIKNIFFENMQSGLLLLVLDTLYNNVLTATQNRF